MHGLSVPHRLTPGLKPSAHNVSPSVDKLLSASIDPQVDNRPRHNDDKFVVVVVVVTPRGHPAVWPGLGRSWAGCSDCNSDY